MEEKELKKFKISRIIVAVLAIVLGVLFIIFNKTSTDILIKIAAIVLMVGGVGMVVKYFVTDPSFGNYSLMAGIVMFLGGLLCLIKPDLVKGLLTVLFGIFIVIDGAISVTDSVTCGRARVKGWIIMLIVSVISIVFGVLVMFGTFKNILMIFMGASLIVDGLCDIILLAFFTKNIDAALAEAKRRAEEQKEADKQEKKNKKEEKPEVIDEVKEEDAS